MPNTKSNHVQSCEHGVQTANRIDRTQPAETGKTFGSVQHLKACKAATCCYYGFHQQSASSLLPASILHLFVCSAADVLVPFAEVASRNFHKTQACLSRWADAIYKTIEKPWTQAKCLESVLCADGNTLHPLLGFTISGFTQEPQAFRTLFWKLLEFLLHPSKELSSFFRRSTGSGQCRGPPAPLRPQMPANPCPGIAKPMGGLLHLLPEI